MRFSPKVQAPVFAAAFLCACTAAAAIAATGASVSSNDQFRAAETWAFPEVWSQDPGAPRAKLPQLAASTVMHIPGSTQAYTLAQTRAFRDGERDSPIMHEELSHVSDIDLKLAAEYFSKLSYTRWTRVIEAARVPKTHRDNFTLAVTEGLGTEPIGNRVIVVPANLKRTMLGDTRSGYVAYVPPGSIEMGAKIAAHGVGTAPACEGCHGVKLEGQTMPGIGIVPPLAGRMPNYIVRELMWFREGKRTDPAATPMRAEVSHLTLKDMIDVAAYAASCKP